MSCSTCIHEIHLYDPVSKEVKSRKCMKKKIKLTEYDVKCKDYTYDKTILDRIYLSHDTRD